ncbi:MAG TPA: family 78 glycoside hydrolase catalytic domain [Flavisolibacter sp.]|nr:family 78 glycoside hydrolase catalytic domain [Flavisolibacter sp.]
MKGWLLICFVLASLQGFSQSLRVSKLTCENSTAPLGIETASPSLSWQLQSQKRNVFQTAYRILVADDSLQLKRNIGNVWDSKKINSDQSIQIPYKGGPLLPAKTYYWKVMVWDNGGQSSPWSSVATWQMGLQKEQDWKGARWIGYEEIPDSLVVVPAEHQKGPAKWQGVKDVLPLLRTIIGINKQVKKATAFVCGLGHFEFSINGEKVGDHFLDPGWTKYDKEAQYVAFDVTKNLTSGKNALGIMLGNGFYFIPGERYRKLSGAYGYPKMRLRLQVEYKDGSVQDFVSNESWKTAPGPITFSSIYGGEDYNATLEQEGWNTVAFNDASWRNAVVVKGVPKLYHQLNPPLKVHEVFAGKQIAKINDRIAVYDRGQNASGIPQITVQGKAGDTVRIIPGELLKDDGTVSQRATGSPVYFQYILKGEGVETWQPRFSYYGFRYLQIEIRENTSILISNFRLKILTVKGLHTRSNTSKVGTFTSSSDLFNRIHTLIDWAVKSNMASVLTDCPHREKLGWLEQVHLMGNSIHYNYGVANYFQKTLRDMKTAQGDGFHIPEYVPEFVKMPFMDSIFMDSPEWSSTAIILPWYLYKWYGDRKVLEENYVLMQRYLQHLKNKSKNHILAYGLSDWYDLGPARPGLAQLTPMGLTGTAIYYYNLTVLQKAAQVLGKKEDVQSYKLLGADVKNAFNQTFFKKDSLYYGTNSQTANAMALYMGLVPDEYKSGVLENLIKDIRSRNNSITAGDIGFRYLLQTLQNEGRSDVIYDMNSRSDVPGYGYQLAKGATALTESWQALPIVSNNHLMLGHLMEWFHSGLGGIRQSESSVGYKQIVIDPQVVGDITFAKVDYESPYGKIQSHWKKENGAFSLQVSVPVNATAIVYLPAENPAIVKEGKHGIDNRKDVKLLGVEKGKLKLQVGSGIYQFFVTKSANAAAPK